MKHQRPKNLVFATVSILITVFFVYFLAKLLIKKNQTTISLPVDPIYTQVKEFIESKTQPDAILVGEKYSVWWVSSDGYNIINDNAYGVESKFNCSDYKSINFDSSLKTIASEFPAFIQKNGFSKNILNTSKSLTDDKFYDYVQAYEKDDLKCVLTASPDCSGVGDGKMWQTISFSCTQDFDKNYTTQAPILRDLKINDSIISISKQIENFAEIQVHYRRTGHYVIAAKENGIWKSLYSGQDIPNCSVMEQYNVPNEIYENCY